MTISQIAWLTDIHLNFIKFEARQKFYKNISETNTDIVLITGDIGEAKDVCELLTEFSIAIEKPIYFVLGNHDYYFGDIVNTRKKIISLCERNNKLVWLGNSRFIKLNKSTILVGHDGWADARYGNFDTSPVNLNDSRLISELFHARLLSRTALKIQMQKLADADADILNQTITEAMKCNPQKIIIATHVPPYPECSWHEDKPSDVNWLPYFSSKATGDVISSAAKKYPETSFLVFCGHTHTGLTVKLFPNLEITTGAAQYYKPVLQKIIAV